MGKTYLNELAYERIKEQILRCQYPPNSFLSEEQLVSELNISRTPIRSALIRLEQEHMIRIISKKGIYVTDVTVDQIHDVYECRCLIEPYAVRYYGAQFSKKNLLSALNQFKAEDVDPWIYFQQDNLFHMQIVDLCGNCLLHSYYQSIQSLNLRLSIHSSMLENRVSASNAEHIAIIKALLRDDFQHAEQLLLSHLEEAKRAAYDTLGNV